MQHTSHSFHPVQPGAYRSHCALFLPPPAHPCFAPLPSPPAGLLLFACLLLSLANSFTIRGTEAYGTITVPITVPGTNYTFNYTGPNTTDILIGVLNGTVPIGRIQSLLFTQLNRFNIYVTDTASSAKSSKRLTGRLSWNKVKPPKFIPQPKPWIAAGPDASFLPQGASLLTRSDGRGGTSYDVQDHDDDDDDDDDDDEEDEDEDDDPKEPIGRVRIQMYTSVDNITIVRFRVKSKWVADVRNVQIRKASYGKVGKLTMTIPGSWRLTKSEKFRLSFQTFIVNATYAKTDTGKNMSKTIEEITKEPWNYYSLLTTRSAPSGLTRGQMWKPFCPWCNSTWWGMG